MFSPPQGPGDNPGHPNPHTPLPPQAPPAPLWEDLGRGRRGLWGFGALAVIFPLLFSFALAFSDEEGTTAGAVTVLAFALVISVFLVWALPRVTTGQGIAVDGGGITFAQKPKWWFRGRSLHVPWHEVVAVRGSDSMRTLQVDNAPGQRVHGIGPLSFYLRRTPPRELVPACMTHVAEGADNPQDDSYSPLARLYFVATDSGQFERVLGAVRAWRPDLAQAPRPTRVPHAGEQAPTGRPQAERPLTEPEGHFDLRNSRRVDWFTQVLVATALGSMFAVPLLALLFNGSSRSDQAPLLLLGTGCLALIVWACLLVMSIPRFWTRQGVLVDRYGISTYRERMWWFRGDRAHLDWPDVHHIDSYLSKSGKSYITLVEVHLSRVDHELRLPSWARLLMPGEHKWGFHTSSRPVLVFNLGKLNSANELLQHLRRTRPGLFREQVLDRAVREQETRRRQAWWAEQQGHAPRQAAPATPTPTEWVDMRTRRAVVWAIGAVFPLYFWVVLAGMAYSLVLEGFAPDTIGSVLLLGALTVPLSVWSLRAMPRCVAHQGVSVDAAGITLVQDPFLWFEGRTAHLPWEGIRTVREDRVGNMGDRFLKVFLHHPDALSVAPHWCMFDNRAANEPPASPHEPLTLVIVKVPPKQRVRVIRAATATRPDLVVTV